MNSSFRSKGLRVVVLALAVVGAVAVLATAGMAWMHVSMMGAMGGMGC